MSSERTLACVALAVFAVLQANSIDIRSASAQPHTPRKPDKPATPHKPHKRTTPKIGVVVKASKHTAKLSEKALAGKTKRERPKLTVNQFLDVERKVSAIRAGQREKLEKLIAATEVTDPELPALLFRLAESYAQEQRYHRFRGFEALELAQRSKGNARKNATRSQRIHAKKEATALENAVRVYARLARGKHFRNYKQMDEALYYFALALGEAKRAKLSRDVYKQLIQDHPQSPYVPHAYLAFADRFFDDDDLENAEAFYKAVLKFPKASIAPFARYKLGWVYLNQDRNQEALSTFFKVAAKTAGDKTRKVLNRAAKKDFVRAYAEVGKATKALKAFERVDERYAPTMLGLLALVYFDKGKARKAIYTFRKLIGMRPRDSRVCEWQYNVQQAVLSVGNKAEIAAETEKLSKLSALVQKVRKKRNLSKSVVKECRDNARSVTGELAKLWHQEADRTFDADTVAAAAILYGTYARYFANAPDIGIMNFHHADLLWADADRMNATRGASLAWEKVAKAFDRAVKTRQRSKRVKREAAYASALAWKNALEIDPNTVVPTTTEGRNAPKPRPIERRQKSMLAAFDVYATFLDPGDSELVMMKFLRARVYWRHDHLEKSTPMFLDIVRSHSSHETARYSANIALNNLIRLGRDAELARSSKDMLANKTLLARNPALKSRLVLVRVKGLRMAADKLRAAEKWLECGEAFFEIASNQPSGVGGMDEVLYNAGYCYEQGRSLGYAVSMYTALRDRFPDSPHAHKALVRIGDVYGNIARYEEAAASFEEYARKYGGEELAPDALARAVAFRRGLGDDNAAIKNTELFVRQYRKSQKKETASALFSLTSVYEKQGKPKKVIAHLKRYLRDVGRSGGRARLIVANAMIGTLLWKQSCTKKGVDGACISVSRERLLRRKRKARRGGRVPTRCGETTRTIVTVHGRRKRARDESHTYLKRAVREWEKGVKGIDDKELASAADWAMAAMFTLVEADYEAYLAIKFPTKLDFHPARPKQTARSNKRFKTWFTNKTASALKVRAAYRKVLKGNSAHWAIAAAARMGQVPQSFADALYRAEVPAFVRSGPLGEEGYFAYCGRLEDVARPLETESVEAFRFCLEETTKRNWFNRWARMCESELGHISRQEYPPADEVHGRPVAAAAVTDTSPIVVVIEP